ncbi:cysteine hydrolase family protein [Mycetocola zhadangensis]|uniref:cysteine hydrolase family protein n=1 Tax=Mycetocola zhadangensis TaxID=1164595 RepID=UPI003A4E153D
MTIPFRYDPAHTALIVVDVQNDFCSPNGSLAGVGNDVSAAVEMVPRLQLLIENARAVGMPVVFIQTIHDETNDSPQWLGRIDAGPGTERPGITCRTGSWGGEFYEVAPQPGDHVVIKYRYSAFVGTNLEILLRTLGVQSLLFTGVATEICVESSLRDGLFADYWVSLVEDCAASYSKAAHDASVAVVGKQFGTVTTSDELASVWSAAPALAAV